MREKWKKKEKNETFERERGTLPDNRILTVCQTDRK